MASSYHLLGSERNAFNLERQCFYQRWWWRARELNPRPLRCERSALPTELAPHLEGTVTRAQDPAGLMLHISVQTDRLR